MEEKKIEAVERMKLIGIFPETIRQFEQDGKISISEPPHGAWFGADSEDLEHIREFEESYNVMVYAVIRSYTFIGKLDSYLFVSDDRSEWELDRNTIATMDAGIMAYVYNHDEPCFSEIGFIALKLTPASGLRQIW